MTAQAEIERTMLVRTYEAEIAPGDGRTLDINIVPYNVVATVADPPDFRPYKEMFLPNSFERQVSAPDRVRVWLNFEHEQGLRGIVGHGVQLVDEGDHLRGHFRVHDNADGDKALQLVNDGIATGTSLEFVALRSRRLGDVVQRVRAHIDRVSLCRSPAYAEAGVLAVREQQLELEEQLRDVPAELAPPVSPELTDRLAALGVTPLGRTQTTSKPWDGSAERFDDEQFQRAALLCREGEAPVKERFSLPVLEPDGTLNVNALAAAAATLVGVRGGLVSVSRQTKAGAARKLVRYYGQAGLEPPASLLALARS